MMSDLSERMAALSPAQRALLAVRLKQHGSQFNTFPLSYGQERLWFLHQWQPNNPTYNVPSAMRLRGPLDVDALRASLENLAHRHEILRTTFPSIDGQPVQRIAAPEAFPLPVIDLSIRATRDEREEAMRRALTQDARQPFDLERGPLVRAKLLRLGPLDHVLLLTMHHIVADGWSLAILHRELGVLYAAARQHITAALPPLPIQYADYACWQRGESADTHEQSLAYWRRQLDDAPAVLELPTDYPRPAVASDHGALHPFRMTDTVARQVQVLSHETQATLFMTLLAAFAALLARYSNRTDLLIGTPIAGRTRTETEGLIGFFVNTLVLRVDLSGDPSFREVLRRTRETALDAYAHPETPFEQLVEALHPERTLSHTPLVQVLFAVQNAPQAPLTLSGLTVEPLHVHTDAAKFDLNLDLRERGDGGLEGWLEYRTDLFAAETMARLADHFQTLLAGALADPDCRLSALPLLTPAEREQLLVAWNATDAEFPGDVCIHQLIERQAQRNPHAVAVVCGEERLTYGELDRQATQLAHHLRRLGVGPEVRVGLCLERCAQLVVGMLAILKAGGAYVPLDPDYPADRLRLLLQDAAVPVLLSRSGLHDRLPAFAGKIIDLDLSFDALSTQDTGDSLPANGVTPGNLAYVLYTSGSTGAPKGVLIEHRQLLNYVQAILARLQVSPDARYAMVQPLTVDSSVTALYPPLCTGGQLHIIPFEQATDAQALARHMQAQALDVLKIAPSHLAALQASSPSPERLLPRQRLIIGGESSQWEWVSGLKTLAPECVVFNHYGPTEATVGVLTFRVEDTDVAHVTHVTTPLGRPLANTTLYVLDEHLEPVPIGTPGELYIGGANIARGYLNLPGRTAEQFLPDLFDPRPGQRLYRTGDQVRYLPDGTIEFLGRFDHQIKIRGFRVELGEIEAVLRKHPLVRQALVLARDSASTGKHLVAYVVAHPGRDVPTSSELRAHLQAHLPGYMVPQAFLMLDAFPLTAHGKVDLRALPAPDEARPEWVASYEEPRTEIEQIIVQVWRDVLRLDKVGIHDNFFDLGGHSLLMAQVRARLAAALNREVLMVDLFRFPTIAALAHYFQQGEHRSAPTGHHDDHDDRAATRRERLDQQRALRLRTHLHQQ